MIKSENLIWEIISISSNIKYKTLNPRNMEELSFGLENDILQCNKNTLLNKPSKNEELWNSLFN